MFHPRSKIAQLSIVSVIRKPHLRPNEKDLAVVNNHSTIVDYVLVNNGPGNIEVTVLRQEIVLTSQCHIQYP